MDDSRLIPTSKLKWIRPCNIGVKINGQKEQNRELMFTEYTIKRTKENAQNRSYSQFIYSLSPVYNKIYHNNQ